MQLIQRRIFNNWIIIRLDVRCDGNDDTEIYAWIHQAGQKRNNENVRNIQGKERQGVGMELASI